MSLNADPQRAAQVGAALYQAFHGDGVLGAVSMPEAILPDTVERGSVEHLHFITLTVAVDYMRDADALWAASRKTISDPTTSYLYMPHAVAAVDFERLVQDMRKYRLSKKAEKDARIWRDICITLVRHFEGDVRVLLERQRFHAPTILATIRTPRYNFPFLKGAKIGPLWLRILDSNWRGNLFTGLVELPIPVDIHIAAATVMTGCVQGPFEGPFSVLRNAIEELWFSACEGTPYYPLQFDEGLWHLSRRGCRKTQSFPCEFRWQCPVAQFCAETPMLQTADWITVGKAE